MAGESLPDAKLTKLLQGDVTPLAPREHSRAIRAVPIPLRLGRGVPAAARRPGAPSGGPIDPFRGLRGQAGGASPALRDPFSGLRGRDTGDTGESDTGEAGRAALDTLLDQIDARWPLRKRGVHDGLVSEAQHTGFLRYEPRTTLWISEDNGTNGATPLGPNILALLYVLRADPRTETTEIVKSDLWRPLDVSYLKVTVKRGAYAQDPRPWDLSALDLPITPEAGGLGPDMGRWQSTMSPDADVHARPEAGARDPFAGLGSLPVT